MPIEASHFLFRLTISLFRIISYIPNMKTIHICLTLVMFLLTSCVSRTVTEKPVGGDNASTVGLMAKERVIEKKWIWIWEDEYQIKK